MSRRNLTHVLKTKNVRQVFDKLCCEEKICCYTVSQTQTDFATAASPVMDAAGRGVKQDVVWMLPRSQT